MNCKKFLFLLGLISLGLIGCRSEGSIEQDSLHQQEAKKIVFFENYANNKNHKYSQKWLNYDNADNPAIPFAQSVKVYLENHPKIDEAIKEKFGTIDFGLSTQVYTDKEGFSIVFFPIVKGRKPTSVLGVTTDKENTHLFFRVYEKGVDDFFDGVINSFSAHYLFDYKIATMDPTEREIAEVVIVVYNYLSSVDAGRIYFSSFDIFRDERYYDDLPVHREDYGGGGNSRHFPSQNNSNPCDRLNIVGKNNKTKDLMKDLKKEISSNREKGYVLKYENGNISPRFIEGMPNTAEINFIVDGQIDGMLHTHYKGLLSVFSVSDIFSLAYLYKNGHIRNMDTFVMGLVTENTQYMMVIEDPKKFANFANNLFEGNEIPDMSKRLYEHIYAGFGISTDNSIGENEKAFVNYLRASSTGLKLMKGDKNMNDWKSLDQDNNNNVITKNCK